ncbi:MAG: hypothetical protein SFZ02_19110 [bacterium]|nr:hypothetical protein [bacterium]
MSFRRVWNIFAVIVIVFVIGTPLTMAQDATEEAPAGDVVVVPSVLDELKQDATNTFADAIGRIVLIVVAAIGAVQVVVSGTFAVVITKFGERLYQSTPPQYKPALANLISDGIDRLQAGAESTKFTFDDDFVRQLREAMLPVIQAELLRTSNDLLERVANIAGKKPINEVVG